jgi:hypothetical protein
MRRYFESLRPADVSAMHSVPDGIFLVWVDRAQYHWHKQKPYCEIRFAVLKPKHLTGCFNYRGVCGGHRRADELPKNDKQIQFASSGRKSRSIKDLSSGFWCNSSVYDSARRSAD